MSAAHRVKDQLGLKLPWTLPEYLQRLARHTASTTDWEHAQAIAEERGGEEEIGEVGRLTE